MNPKHKLIWVIVILVLLPFYDIKAQISNTPKSSIEVLTDLDKRFGVDQRLVSGNFYHGAPSGSVKGHPYSIDTEWKTGQVTIEGIVFDSLLLKFDIVTNNLVLNTINLNNLPVQLCLKTGRISEFTIADKKYVRYQNSKRKGQVQFYEVQTEGHIDYLLIRSKELRVSNSGMTDFEYIELISNYLHVNGELIRYNGKRTLYKLFRELRPSLRKYVSQEKLYLGSKQIGNTVMIVDYCNFLLGDTE